MDITLGITMRIVEHSTYPERRDVISQEWGHYLLNLFPKAIVIPVVNQPDHVQSFMERVKPTGMILSNGNDWLAAPERDTTEKKIMDYCVNHKIPVLGVCRGLHVTNVFFGGTVSNDITLSGADNHVSSEHTITLTHRSFLGKKNTTTITTNSFHDQGLFTNNLSRELHAFARTKDGIIEGIFHSKLPILAVQWHPERPNSSPTYTNQLITKLFCKGVFWNGK